MYDEKNKQNEAKSILSVDIEGSLAIFSDAFLSKSFLDFCTLEWEIFVSGLPTDSFELNVDLP